MAPVHAPGLRYPDDLGDGPQRPECRGIQIVADTYDWPPQGLCALLLLFLACCHGNHVINHTDAISRIYPERSLWAYNGYVHCLLTSVQNRPAIAHTLNRLGLARRLFVGIDDVDQNLYRRLDAIEKRPRAIR